MIGSPVLSDAVNLYNEALPKFNNLNF